MTCGRYFFRDMKNAVPAFRFRFSLVDDALKLLVESCRNTADFVTLVLIVPYAADVSMENSLTLATPSMCRRTTYAHAHMRERYTRAYEVYVFGVTMVTVTKFWMKNLCELRHITRSCG